MKTTAQKRTERDIILALISLLENHKFTDISINAICEQALIHRSTFYRYFNDKFNLAESLLSELADRLIDQANHDERDLLSQIAIFIDSNLNLFRNLIPDQQSKFFPEFSRIFTDLINSRIKETQEKQDILIQAIHRSNYPELMIPFITNAVMGVLAIALDSHDEQKLQDTRYFLLQTIEKLAEPNQTA